MTERIRSTLKFDVAYKFTAIQSCFSLRMSSMQKRNCVDGSVSLLSNASPAAGDYDDVAVLNLKRKKILKSQKKRENQRPRNLFRAVREGASLVQLVLDILS